MRENCTSGEVRGAPGNGRSYRGGLPHFLGGQRKLVGFFADTQDISYKSEGISDFRCFALRTIFHQEDVLTRNYRMARRNGCKSGVYCTDFET